MAITGEQLVNQARELMKDSAANPFDPRYSDAFFLEALNFGQLEIVNLKHDAHTENTPYELTAGTRQKLPDDAVAFLRLTRNLGADGSTPGRTITSTTKADLDSSDPYWHQTLSAGEVIHYVFEDVNEDYFYVYPQHTGFVELVYSKVPEKLATLADNIALMDVYAPALVYFLLFRAYAVDYDDPVMRDKAREFYSFFANAIGAKLQNELTISPNEAPQ